MKIVVNGRLFYSGESDYISYEQLVGFSNMPLESIVSAEKEVFGSSIDVKHTDSPKTLITIREGDVFHISCSTPGVNYHQVIPNSHYWTDLKHLLNCLNLTKNISVEYLKVGLENTLKNGYNLIKDDSK